ncbi:hypothetical protein [Methylobacter sp.]|nr:hypothetical protein [Methylobacter sp.]
MFNRRAYTHGPEGQIIAEHDRRFGHDRLIHYLSVKEGNRFEP